jgi:hypothetical protein
VKLELENLLLLSIRNGPRMNNAIASSTGENKTRPATAPATSTARLIQTPGPSVGHTVLQGRDEGHGPSPRAIAVQSKPAEPRGDRDERVKVLMGALSPWSFRPVSRLPGPGTTPQRKAAAFSREGAGAVWPSTGCGHCDCRGGPEPGTPLGGLGCPPQGGRHMNHATDWLGTAAVRSDPLYPAKRAKPGRGAREVEDFSELSLNATASPERIVPRWGREPYARPFRTRGWSGVEGRARGSNSVCTGGFGQDRAAVLTANSRSSASGAVATPAGFPSFRDPGCAPLMTPLTP